MWLNFLFLLPLSILPFGAAMLATYERDPIALRIYGLILIAIVVTRLATWLYATRRSHILATPVDARARRGGIFLVALPGVAYLVGLAVADATPTLAIWIYALVPVVYFVMIWVLRSSAPKSSVTEEFT